MLTSNESWREDISLLNKEEIERRVEAQVSAIQKEFIASNKDTVSDLKETLELFNNHLRRLDAHYDFELWHQTEISFEQMWPELFKSLNLAIEYGLYELVRSIFLEIRHLLETTGHTKERIYLATWIKNEAEQNQDIAGKNIALSSLVWSYTSAGKHQDLEKAYEAWQALSSFRRSLGNPFKFNSYRKSLLKEIGQALYTEILMDVYEGGVRLAVRQRKFNEASKYTSQARDEISILAQRDFLSERLKERLDIAYTYHEGVAYYLTEQHQKAHEKFNDVIQRGEYISWTRSIRGAKSWLATLAIERKDYDECERILKEISEEHPELLRKRDGMCHLIKAQLLSEKGRQTEKIKYEQMANLAFSRFTEDNSEQTLSDNTPVSLALLCRAFSLSPCLAG